MATTADRDPRPARTADVLTRSLCTIGARYFFSVSGANIEPVHDAIVVHGGIRLRSVLAKHESGAAFMADCYARVHRRIGLCGSTSGGGMMNLIAGVAEANVESVPLLALVGLPPRALWGLGAFQDGSGIGRTVDALGLFRAVAKHVAQVGSPREVVARLREAVASCVSGRPGASVLLLPRDVLLESCDEAPHSFCEAELTPASAPAAADVQRLHDAIARSLRPIAVLGHGVLRSSHAGDVVEYLRARHIPVLTTLSGKGAFPNDDPLYWGCLGLSGNPSTVERLTEADLVIIVGMGLNAMTRTPIHDLLRTKLVAYVNVEEGYIEGIVTPSVKVIADAGIVFRCLRSLGHPVFEPCWGSPRPVTELATVRSPGSGHGNETGTAESRLTMAAAMRTIRELIPQGTHLVVDAGNAGASAAHFLGCPVGGSFTTALGMGGMGYAIAGAAGAALPAAGTSATPTIVVAGDGAMLMNGTELNTIVAEKLPVLIIVLNNGGHGMCRVRQHLYFESRFDCVDYPEVDMAGFSQALAGEQGLRAVRVDTAEALQARFTELVAANTPAVIDVRVTSDELPPFLPFRVSAVVGTSAETLAQPRSNRSP